MTDKFFASGLAAGGVSILNYADRLIQFPVIFFLAIAGRTITPVLTSHISRGELVEVKKNVYRWIRALNFILIPLMIMFFIFNQPIVKLAFQRGAFSAHDAQLTSTAFFYYNLGLIFYCYNMILNVALFCLQDTLTPTKITLWAVLLNAVLDFGLMKFMGLGGLALATSLVAMWRTELLFRCLQDKIGALGRREIFQASLQPWAAAGVMGLVSWIILNWQKEYLLRAGRTHQALIVTGIALAGTGIYLLVCKLLKVEEYQKIGQLLARRRVS